MIDLISILLSIFIGIFQWHNSPERKQKRNDHERDKELANQDSIAISKRLSDLYDKLWIHNRKKRKLRTSRRENK